MEKISKKNAIQMLTEKQNCLLFGGHKDISLKDIAIEQFNYVEANYDIIDKQNGWRKCKNTFSNGLQFDDNSKIFFDSGLFECYSRNGYLMIINEKITDLTIYIYAIK